MIITLANAVGLLATSAMPSRYGCSYIVPPCRHAQIETALAFSHIHTERGSYMSKKGVAYVLVLFLLSVFMSFGAVVGKASVNHTHGPDGTYIEAGRE